MTTYEQQMTVEQMNAIPEGKQAYTLSNAAVASILSTLHNEVYRIDVALQERQDSMSDEEYSMFCFYKNRMEDALTQLSIQIDLSTQEN